MGYPAPSVAVTVSTSQRPELQELTPHPVILLTRYPFPLAHCLQKYATFLPVVFPLEPLRYSSVPNPCHHLTPEGQRQRRGQDWLFSHTVRPIDFNIGARLQPLKAQFWVVTFWRNTNLVITVDCTIRYTTAVDSGPYDEIDDKGGPTQLHED